MVRNLKQIEGRAPQARDAIIGEVKTLKTLLFAMAAATLVFSFGCSTPETRIRQDPELFAQLAPEQQEMIRRGQVAVGFNAEMVRLALGEPDRYTTRTDQDGTSEIWHYVIQS